MLERDALISELNAASARVAELRSAEEVDTDALTSAIVGLSAVREELSALDARQAPVFTPAQAAPSAPTTFVGALRETGLIDRAVAGERGTVLVEGRDIFTGTGVAGAQDIVIPQYESTIERRLRTEQTILDVLPVRTTNSDTIVYFMETGFSNAAAPVARRANGTYGSYAESDITIAKRTANCVKIGHYVRTDADSLADAGQLQSILEDELGYGVRQNIEAQLLADTNTTNGLPSLLVDAQGMTYAAGADGAAKLDAIRQAKTLAEVALLPADFVAMNPADIEAIDLAKDGSERYLANGPFAGGPQTIWGLTVVTSHSLPAGKIVVGSTRAVALYSRRATEVTVSDNVGEDFLEDALRIKASARLALANKRPEAMVVITEELD
jgi:HK97 family phage major capsid protein